MNLRAKIVQEVRARGPIPFSRYMELCLYEPEMGYYSRSVEQFGKAGDFYTSSDVHAVFGRLLSRQFEEMWRVLGSPKQMEVLELGPGRGLFARDVLDWSEKKFPAFFGALHYTLAERSRALQERLEVTLDSWLAREKATLLQGRFQPAPAGTSFHRALAPEVPLIVFGNEFFDALPLEVLSPQGQLSIAEKEGQFLEIWNPAGAEEIAFLDRYSVHPEAGERIEVSLVAQEFMSAIAASLERGFLVVIDYGYTRAEQLAGRHRGTLMAYRQHSASANPYEAPGEQDITAHVNFTALASAAEQQGMHLQPVLTQSQFLMGIGEQNQFADAFEECRLPQERAKVALQLKHLVTPAGMGESFHVLVASKGIEPHKVASLSGLTFGRRGSQAQTRSGVGIPRFSR